jgi:PAS domain S-box-containing protein
MTNPAPSVLIVDDDPALLQALPETLRLRLDRVTVDISDSAWAALERLAVADYDAIICDIKMPGMDGLGLLAEIRARRPDTPTLLITGHGDHDLAVQALRGGAYDFIQKPIDRNYLVASLNRAIQMRRLSRQVAQQRLALERHANELEQKVQERTRELLEANRAKDESLALLDALLASAPVGLAFLDRELRYVRVNDSLAAINGLAREAHIGRPIQEVVPELTPVLQPLRQHVLETGESVVGYEVSGETKAAPGQLRHWLVTYYPVRVQQEHTLGLGVVVADITERKQMEEELKASLREKEVLLKEIHHRVKNNLQVISSLLDLESSYLKDQQTHELFKASQNRIKSMALIHEKLYQSQDLSRIDFTEYIRKLIDHLVRSYRIKPGAITVKITAAEMFLGIDTAIPCGLIVNELVSNSLKHAFPTAKSGEICIDLHANTDGTIVLIVSDNGVGLPRDFDFRTTESLGLQLVNILVDQLNGTIAHTNINGTTFTITFAEVIKYKKRDEAGGT